MSEFLSYTEGDTAASKQDCEQKAFKRLAVRLKQEFPCLPVMVLLDGLYPNGLIMELCRKNNWQFMIVLQDGSLAERLGHFFNVIAQHATHLVGVVRTLGKCGLIRFIKETIAAPWLDRDLISPWLAGPCQIRIV